MVQHSENDSYCGCILRVITFACTHLLFGTYLQKQIITHSRIVKLLRTKILCCMRMEDFMVSLYVCPAMNCLGNETILHVGSGIPMSLKLDQLGPLLSHAILRAQSSCIWRVGESLSACVPTSISAPNQNTAIVFFLNTYATQGVQKFFNV